MANRDRMVGPITRCLAEDHARRDALLTRSVLPSDGMDMEAFGEFRAGLLRHIAIEEKLVFPALREARGGAPLSEIRSILELHNALEEGPEAICQRCDELPPDQVALVLERMRAYPPIRVASYRDGPRVLRRASDALRVSAMQFDKVGGRP